MTTSPGAIAAEPRAFCWDCARPVSVCWCRHVPRIECGTRVLLLQHPREEFMPIGTARMTAACLPSSTLVVGTELDNHPKVREVLSDPDREIVLLWPGPGAKDLRTLDTSTPKTLVVVDGTWALARKLVRINPGIGRLPRYALAPERASQYRIRAEPRAECVSTIEATMLALGILERDEPRFAAMLQPFTAMIDTQIDHQLTRQGHRHRRGTGPKPRPVPAALRDLKRVVVMAGEANAWPHRRTLAEHQFNPPHEVVQVVAVRADTGERFEAVIAPRQPLAPMTPIHTRLSAETVRAGISFEEFQTRWRAFLSDEDVLCSWGPYAPGLIIKEGGFLPRRCVDLRFAASRWLRGPAGSVEELCARWELHPAPVGLGRGGERAARALAVARYLHDHAGETAGPS